MGWNQQIETCLTTADVRSASIATIIWEGVVNHTGAFSHITGKELCAFQKSVIGIDELPLAPGSLRDVHRYHMFIVIPRAHEAYHSNLVERPLFQPVWKWQRATGALDAIGLWRNEWLGSQNPSKLAKWRASLGEARAPLSWLPKSVAHMLIPRIQIWACMKLVLTCRNMGPDFTKKKSFATGDARGEEGVGWNLPENMVVWTEPVDHGWTLVSGCIVCWDDVLDGSCCWRMIERMNIVTLKSSFGALLLVGGPFFWRNDLFWLLCSLKPPPRLLWHRGENLSALFWLLQREVSVLWLWAGCLENDIVYAIWDV